MFTELFHNIGCVCHISFRDNSSIVCLRALHSNGYFSGFAVLALSKYPRYLFVISITCRFKLFTEIITMILQLEFCFLLSELFRMELNCWILKKKQLYSRKFFEAVANEMGIGSASSNMTAGRLTDIVGLVVRTFRQFMFWLWQRNANAVECLQWTELFIINNLHISCGETVVGCSKNCVT
jgi:hypothetical protein